MIMDSTFTFNGIFLLYPCPFCGKPKSRNGKGQSILWIAQECIEHGSAMARCDHCGKAFTIPKEIFDNVVLNEMRKVAQLPGDQLYDFVTNTYVTPSAQARILKPGWYDILRKANAAGPVDTLAIEWHAGEKCPHCGKKADSHPIGFTYRCPQCGVKVGINQQDIHSELGVQVICYKCGHTLHIPPSVWCPKCKQALLDYYDILCEIAGWNGVSVDQLDPENTTSANEAKNISRDQPGDPAPLSKPTPSLEGVPSGTVKIRAIGDFLKIIGMRVEIMTKKNESYEVTVRDLSDTGTHILLDEVFRMEETFAPHEKVFRIARRNLEKTGDLSKYVNQRIRLRLKAGGYVEGRLHSDPGEIWPIKLTVPTYYRPCQVKAMRIDEIDIIKVVNRAL
jgi:hypothetical protein